MNLRERLEALRDPAYRDFSQRLLPGVDDLLGVRLPDLRRLAREIARGDWREFLGRTPALFEERMLQGMVIGCARCRLDERLEHMARFIPRIDNWSVCDAFCRRMPPGEREALWRFIRPYFGADSEFEARFAAVEALMNFADPSRAGELLAALEEVRHPGYYARMGVAWAVAELYVKAPDATLAWLAEGRLDAWTHNKSLQKITESLRVGDAEKQRLRRMKRPGKIAPCERFPAK